MKSETVELHRTLNARLEWPLWTRLPLPAHYPVLRGYHQRRLDERVWGTISWPVLDHLGRRGAAR